MCLNRKVLIGLAAVGVGVWVVAPQTIGAALPLLIVAVCPLSMLLMMKGMNGGGSSCKQETAAPADAADAQSTNRVSMPATPARMHAAVAGAGASLTVEELRSELRELQAQQVAVADQLEAYSRRQPAS